MRLVVLGHGYSAGFLTRLLVPQGWAVTGTTRDVHPVHRVDDRELPAPGPVTTRVQQAWDAASATEINP